MSGAPDIVGRSAESPDTLFRDRCRIRQSSSVFNQLPRSRFERVFGRRCALFPGELTNARPCGSLFDAQKTGDTMNKIEFALLAFIGICGFASSPAVVPDAPSQRTAAAGSGADASSDPQITLLRENIRSLRKKLIAANLTLTDSEAAKFWPVFEQYSAELGNITDTRFALIREYLEGYGTLTDEQVDSLIRRWLDTDIATAQLRQKYLPILREVLPGMKAMTFFLLDRQISTIIDLQLTSLLPLAQQEVFSVPDTSPPSFAPPATNRPTAGFPPDSGRLPAAVASSQN